MVAYTYIMKDWNKKLEKKKIFHAVVLQKRNINAFIGNWI